MAEKKAKKVEKKPVDESEDDIQKEGDSAVSEVTDQDLELGDIPNPNEDESGDEASDLEVEPGNQDSATSNELGAEFQLEQMATSEMPQAIVRPKVVAGVCEFCGVPCSGNFVYDRRISGYRVPKPSDSADVIQHCKHYHGIDMICGYCRNAEMSKQRTIFVYSLPNNPKVLITCCDDFRCVDKHQKRFSGGNGVPSTAQRIAN